MNVTHLSKALPIQILKLLPKNVIMSNDPRDR